MSGLEAGVALVDGAVLHVPQPVLETGARRLRDRVFPGHDSLHVDTYRADVHAILGGASRHARRVSARHHRLGRNAAGIDTSSAEDVALDDGDFHAGTRETRGHVRAGLAGADDDRVVDRCLHWLLLPRVHAALTVPLRSTLVRPTAAPRDVASCGV